MILWSIVEGHAGCLEVYIVLVPLPLENQGRVALNGSCLCTRLNDTSLEIGNRFSRRGAEISEAEGVSTHFQWAAPTQDLHEKISPLILTLSPQSGARELGMSGAREMGQVKT